MRVTKQQMRRRVARISHRILAVIALCGVALPVMADELMQTLPNLWVSATALSLTLVTAASKPKN